MVVSESLEIRPVQLMDPRLHLIRIVSMQMPLSLCRVPLPDREVASQIDIMVYRKTVQLIRKGFELPHEIVVNVTPQKIFGLRAIVAIRFVPGFGRDGFDERGESHGVRR